MAIHFQGRDYKVAVYRMPKDDRLIGFSVDGKHVGNFRIEDDAYRYGLGKDAKRFPKTISELAAGEKCALEWLSKQAEKRRR